MQHYPSSQRIIYHDLNMSAPSVAHGARYALERQNFLTITSMPHGCPSMLEITPLGIERQREGLVGRAATSDEVTP